MDSETRAPRSHCLSPPGHSGVWSWLARAGSPEFGVVLIFGSFLLFLPLFPKEGFKPFLHPQAVWVLPSVFLLGHLASPSAGLAPWVTLESDLCCFCLLAFFSSCPTCLLPGPFFLSPYPHPESLESHLLLKALWEGQSHAQCLPME